MEIEPKTTAAIPFTDRLRAETAQAHQLLEALPLSRALVGDGLTITQYVNYLATMRSFVLATERDLFPRLEKIFPDLDKRKKLHQIDRDLEFLGITPTESDFAFEPSSTEHAAGMLYVMEGSVLGGRYILNNVQKILKLSSDFGASYFAGYGNQTGIMWKNFLNAFSDYADSANQNAIIEGANQAFIGIREKFAAQ